MPDTRRMRKMKGKKKNTGYDRIANSMRDLISTYKAPINVVGRAAKAAGTSLAKDYQGSSLQKKFEGTPITAETRFETHSSPMRKMARAVKPRGTISYPEQTTIMSTKQTSKDAGGYIPQGIHINRPKKTKPRKENPSRKIPMPANTGRRR